jgi:hypothetical protein
MCNSYQVVINALNAPARAFTDDVLRIELVLRRILTDIF